MASPPSSTSTTGRPSFTAAMRELVVPRSMPTARVVPGGHAALTRDSPGSEIWNSASGMSRLLGLGLVVYRHFVQETAQVAHLDQIVGDALQSARGPGHRRGRCW